MHQPKRHVCAWSAQHTCRQPKRPRVGRTALGGRSLGAVSVPGNQAPGDCSLGGVGLLVAASRMPSSNNAVHNESTHSK
jgi:hypothetical protein